MAADEERLSVSKKTDRGVKKLLPGEEVEVLCSEEGLKGSWHFGVIIGCGMLSRTVKLVDLLNEDNCSKVVDSVRVSAVIEGLRRNIPKLHRNWIRPLPPKYRLKKTELVYGLCVDAFVDDAWWEGVVFDHNDGSLSRLIFFPDQGDQQVVSFENLRVTQEWNEATGRWKPRGVWPFLQVIHNFERKRPLPVSIREIWYDLRSMTSFLVKIGVWISGPKFIWHELVGDLIQELRSIVGDLPVEESNNFAESCEKPIDLDVTPRQKFSVFNGNLLKENGRSSSGSADIISTLMDPNDHSCHITAYESHADWGLYHEEPQLHASKDVCTEQASVLSGDNEPNNIPDPYLKQCVLSLKHESIDEKNCVFDGKVHGGFQDLAQTNCLNFNSVSNDWALKHQGTESKDSVSDITALECSEAWQLINFGAENCAEAIRLYLHNIEHGDYEPQKSKLHDKWLESIRLKVKRHLIALGWNIEAKRERGRRSVRIRFVSPMGRCYNSLRSACFGLLKRQQNEKNECFPKKRKESEPLYKLNDLDKQQKKTEKLNKLKSLDGYHFVSRSYGVISMSSGGEYGHDPDDDSLNELFPVMKKHQVDDSSPVIELNVSTGDAYSRTYLQRNCRLLSGLTKCKIISNNRARNEDSSCSLIDGKCAEAGCSSSGNGALVSEVYKKKFPMHKGIEPEHSPAALTEYVNYRNSRGQADAEQSIVNVNYIQLNAKKHLLFMGWRILKTNRAIFYISPSGKPFQTLYLACKACLEEENQGAGTTSRSVLAGNSKRRLEYLHGETKSANDGKKLLRRVRPKTATMPEENILEVSIELQDGTQKRCTDSSKSAESTACSFSQMPMNDELRHSKKRRMSTSTCQYSDQKLLRHSSGYSSICAKIKKRKTLSSHVRKPRGLTNTSSCRVHQSSKRSREVDALSPSQHASISVLSLLIENDVVLPRQKVFYICKKDKRTMMEGRITREGIKCKCCSKVYTPSCFEAHAGSNVRHPFANIFLKDGRSLLQCQIQMLSSKIPEGIHRSRMKGDCSIYESDSICSICHDGGSLILCDHCPSSFHLDCVGLEAVPEDKWFCPYCRCHICGMSEFSPDTENFTERTVLFCDQCEHEYHVGCMRKRGGRTLQSCPPGNWFCSRSCSKIFLDLRKLVGVSKPTSVEGLSCTVLRFCKDYRSGSEKFDSEVQVEHHSKLCVALKVLHECFVTILEPRTQSDIVADILFNKESELKRLNFYGFYTILLEKGDELISVATLRIYGDKIAEMPLIGTRVKYRRQGMCRLLVGEIEKILISVGVKRFLLPAVPQLLETWTSSFGFTKMSSADRLNLSDYTLLNFQDTTMCQKILRVAPMPETTTKDTFSDRRENGPKAILALPCFPSNHSSPDLASNGTCEPASPASPAPSFSVSKLVDESRHAMWNEMSQAAVDCAIKLST